MTSNQIITALDQESFPSKELHRIDCALHVALGKANAQEDHEAAIASPRKFDSDWGMYTPEVQADCRDHDDPDAQAIYCRDYNEAKEALNVAGRTLVVAIRNHAKLTAKEISPSEQICHLKVAFEKIDELQCKYEKFGAADTEGREMLWFLVQKACKGTDHDPQAIWDRFYAG